MRTTAMLLLLTLTMVVFTGCESVTSILDGERKPTVRLLDASVRDLSFDAATIDLKLRVANHYDLPLPLTDVSYALRANDRQLIAGDANLEGTIPAGKARTVTIPVTARLDDLLNTIPSLMPGSTLSYEADLDVHLTPPIGNKFSVPVSTRGTLPIPAIPTLKIKRLALNDVSLSNIAADAVLEIENPNAFGIDLSGMNLGMKLAGREVWSASVASGTSIESGASSIVHIPLNLNILDVGTALFEALQSRRIDYAIDGNVGFDTVYGALQTPVSASGRVPIAR